MFELRDMTRSFGPTRAVDQIDLVIEPSKTTVLIGPSGCGKSTLFRLMLGLIEPSSGTVTFQGSEVTKQTAPAFRRKMGYVVQGGGLFPHLTGRENVALLARQLDWNEAHVQNRVSELARLARIDPELLERFPAQISGGQQQRVALLRALMLDPDVLLLDEPLGALDPIVRAELQAELKQTFETLGKTVVLVTHDMNEAAFLADTIVLMKDGRLVQRGTFDELNRAPADPFVTRFMNAQRGFASR